MSRNAKQTETIMSRVERYLTKHSTGDLITQRMIVQNCGLDKGTAGKYLHYMIRVGVGKKAMDETNATVAMKFTPKGDQRVRKIAWRKEEPAGNRSAKNKTVGYVKPAEPTPAPPPAEVEALPALPPAPPPRTWTPTSIPLAADPVLLEKFDLLITRVDTMISRLDRMIATWEKA